MLSCEFCVIFKGTFFTEHLRVTVSGRMCSDNTSTNNCPQLLTRFVPLTFFSNPKNIRKPDLWFSVFSEGIEIDKWQKRVNRIIGTLKKFSRPRENYHERFCFRKFASLQRELFSKTRTLSQAISWKFCQIIQRSYSVDHL